MHYVMSDIHGQKRRFESVLQQIALQPTDTLYVLGDVIDRNPHGIELLQTLRAMPNAELLLGNHEYMMLDALYYPHEDDTPERQDQRLSLWYRNGGAVTHGQLLPMRPEQQAELFSYLDALPLERSVTVENRRYLLVHAAPVRLFDALRPYTRYTDKKRFAVWYRFQGQEPLPEGETIIFGHTPTSHYQPQCDPLEIWRTDGLIGLDCGACYPDKREDGDRQGRLACMRLEDGAVFYSEEATDETPESALDIHALL